jgi:signal transduction histidine kinase
MTSLSSIDLLSEALPPLSFSAAPELSAPVLDLREQLWLEQQLHQVRSHLDVQVQRLPFDAAAGCNPMASLMQSLAQLLAQLVPEARWYGVLWQDGEQGFWQRCGTGIEVQEVSLEELQDGQRSQQAWPLIESDQCLAWLVGKEAAAGGLSLGLRSALVERSIQQLLTVVRQARQLQQLHGQQQELRGRNHELAKISQLKSEFLANTSHEIRTPLSSILGFTHLLREQGYAPGNPKHQEYLRIILTSGQHLLALINDILDLSKIEANQMDLQGEMLAVEPLCRTGLMLVQEKANDKGLQLKLEIGSQISQMFVDPLRLKQMLFNLLSNALKFTSSGEVGLSVVSDDADLRFTVWDTGVGIPPEQLALLFKPYQQLPVTAAQRGEGTGLGLTLTKKLAELHGGRVEVTSEPGQGSRFTIVLPRQPLVELPIAGAIAAAPVSVNTLTTATQSSVPKRAKRPRKMVRSYHVLLVEDNTHNAHLIIAYLCKLGYEVTWTKSGEEMWRSLSHSLPAMILMDVNLPEKGGLTLVRELRENPRYAQLPIIVQTAMAMMGDRETCLESGANDYVAKPLDLQKLADTLAKYSDPGLR